MNIKPCPALPHVMLCSALEELPFFDVIQSIANEVAALFNYSVVLGHSDKVIVLVKHVNNNDHNTQIPLYSPPILPHRQIIKLCVCTISIKQ